MKKILIHVLFVVATNAFAQNQYFNKNGIAINGYDPVAYFTENAAIQGSSDYSYEWNGNTWQFKNAANRDMFKSDPGKYSPQFGGYCAYGVSENHKAPTEPQA